MMEGGKMRRDTDFDLERDNTLTMSALLSRMHSTLTYILGLAVVETILLGVIAWQVIDGLGGTN